MGNYPDENKSAFVEAQYLLTGAGYKVISPWESPLNDVDYPNKENLKWEDYIEADLKLMLNRGFEGVAVLNNAEWSPGSRAEVQLAMMLRKPVLPLEIWLQKADFAAGRNYQTSSLYDVKVINNVANDGYYTRYLGRI